MISTILVTGGLGYIGSHTIVELMQCGHNVIILDNLSNSSESVLEGIEKIVNIKPILYIADIRDSNILKRIFKAYNVDSVIHFAGLKAVGEGEEKPLLYFDNNVTGSITLFDEMVKAGVKRVIFSSSATVYGASDTFKFTEDMPLNPSNVYGQTKLKVENILRELKKTNPSLGISILRYFNPVGAHESGLIGEDPNGLPNNLMPCIAKVAVNSLPYLNVYGDDYLTDDGTGVRDFIHVEDLASGHLAAIDFLARTDDSWQAINLGTGHGISVLQLIFAFEDVSQKKIPWVKKPRRLGDIASCYADVNKAKKSLNWVAQRSTAEMCSTALKFLTDFKDDDPL
jgi:UDP-glucose 4-epimerase